MIRGGLAALLLVAVSAAAAIHEDLESAVLRGDLAAIEQWHAAAESRRHTDDGFYAWAYSGWRVTQLMPAQRKRERDKKLKALQKALEDYLDKRPDDAEVLALYGTVLGDRIGGALSAMRLGGKASRSLEAAYELAPDNPRVALQRGIGFFFTPGAFGGGKDKAEVELRRARRLYEQQGAPDPAVGWGYLHALARLGEVLAAQNKFDEARGVYQQALKLAPEFVLVRDQLLPALPAT